MGSAVYHLGTAHRRFAHGWTQTQSHKSTFVSYTAQVHATPLNMSFCEFASTTDVEVTLLFWRKVYTIVVMPSHNKTILLNRKQHNNKRLPKKKKKKNITAILVPPQHHSRAKMVHTALPKRKKKVYPITKHEKCWYSAVYLLPVAHGAHYLKGHASTVTRNVQNPHAILDRLFNPMGTAYIKIHGGTLVCKCFEGERLFSAKLYLRCFLQLCFVFFWHELLGNAPLLLHCVRLSSFFFFTFDINYFNRKTGKTSRTPFKK